MPVLSKHSSVLIATFSPWIGNKRLPINGNVEPMRDYFVPKVHNVVLIDQPYPGSDFVLPRIEIYENNKDTIHISSAWYLRLLRPFLLRVNTSGTHVLFKIRDFLSVIEQGLKSQSKFDVVIGFEAINALAGVFLRFLGKVKCVIYYVSDYSPNRYKSVWFNELYLWLDRQAAMKADFIWDVSPVMQEERIKAGLKAERSAPELLVTNALYPTQIVGNMAHMPIMYSIVFVGTLGPENGPDIAIMAMMSIVRKFSQSKLHIYGGGDQDMKRLIRLVEKFGLNRNVVFHGFHSDRVKLSREIAQYMIAVAPYIYMKGSARLYGDATKIRAYMASGLPVVTTRVPPLGKIVSHAGAAVIVNDTPEAFGDMILTLFHNPKKLNEMRKNAIKYAKNNTWENEYAKAFSTMDDIIRKKTTST